MEKRRKSLLCLLMIFLGVVFISFSGLHVNAGIGEGNGDGEGLGGDVDPNAPLSGVSKNRSGYLVYLANKDTGAVTSPVVLVPYNAAPASNVDDRLINSRLGGVHYSGTYSGNISTATNGEFSLPPFTIDGGSFGSAMKTKLLELDTNGNAKVYSFIDNVLGDSYKAQFHDNDERLVIEAVAWTGWVSGGNLYAYTAKTGAEIANTFGYTYLTRFWKQRLPKCGYLQYTWCGVPAPSVPSGSIPYPDVMTYGYGMIMIAPVEDTTPEVPEPVYIETATYLKAHELNFAFPDLVRDSLAGRSSDTHTEITNMSAESQWKRHTGADYRNNVIKDDKWWVEEAISSDIVNFYGKNNSLFYRVTAGEWKRPSEVKEFSADNGAADIKPGYAFLYSRSLFGDDLVVCDYKGNGKNYESFITGILKLSVGHDGSSGINVGENKELKSSITKSGSYGFTAKVTEKYEYNDKIKNQATTDINGDGIVDANDYTYTDNWVDREDTYSSSTLNYELTHGIYKYTPLVLNAPNCPSAGTTVFKSTRINRAWTRVIFGSETGMVTLYPEIKYQMYYMSGTETWGSPTPIEVYCMGEKLRMSTGGALHGYKVGYSMGTHMQGKSIVDAPLTGTAAFDWVDNFGDNSQDYMQVCSQGSGFEVATTNNPIVTCTSFTLDLYDGNVSTTSAAFNPAQTWDRPDAKASHDEFTSAISGNLTTEVHMKRFSDKTNNSQVGSADEMSYDISDTRITPTTTEQVRIKVKGGSIISGKDEVISKIASAYGISSSEAQEVWNVWGVETQIRMMLETSAMSNNNSGASGLSNAKWYDEESDCLAITINQSSIIVGDIIFSDKNDYGSSTSQSATDISSIGRNGVEARFYLTLKFINPYIEVDGFTFDLSDKMILVNEDEMKGARFLISNVTTNNWIK